MFIPICFKHLALLLDHYKNVVIFFVKDMFKKGIDFKNTIIKIHFRKARPYGRAFLVSIHFFFNCTNSVSTPRRPQKVSGKKHESHRLRPRPPYNPSCLDLVLPSRLLGYPPPHNRYDAGLLHACPGKFCSVTSPVGSINSIKTSPQRRNAILQ